MHAGDNQVQCGSKLEFEGTHRLSRWRCGENSVGKHVTAKLRPWQCLLYFIPFMLEQPPFELLLLSLIDS